MKQIIKTIAIAVVGIGMTACSSDDDASPVETSSAMVGTWEAKMISYDAGVHSGTYPFDHEIFKKGCITDFLTLNEDKTALLKESNKNGEGVCVGSSSTGMWNSDRVTINGVDRIVKSNSATELVLIYPITFMGQTLDVEVLYTKEVNPMVGTWEAKTISYDAGVHSGTYPFDHEIFKKGCATDFLTLNADRTVSLKENNKNDAGNCIDEISTGTWISQKVFVNGMDRTVKSNSLSELVLIYPITFMGQTLDVEVTYTKQ